jgi:hypothetical protein
MAEYSDAKRTLERLHQELMDINPSAARRLEEGMEETLTSHKLRLPDQPSPDFQHKCDRVSLLYRGDCLPEREAAEGRRSD